MRIDRATFDAMQDAVKTNATDSSTATAVQTAEPEFRTPDNARYMYIAYVVAAVIYGGYLVVLRRRWSAFRKRQTNNASQSRR